MSRIEAKKKGKIRGSSFFFFRRNSIVSSRFPRIPSSRVINQVLEIAIEVGMRN